MSYYSQQFEVEFAPSLRELRGFVTVLPQLWDDYRTARWNEVGRRPSDGSEEQIDNFEREMGPDLGHGFADYDAIACGTADVFAYEIFIDCITTLLVDWVKVVLHAPLAHEAPDKLRRHWASFENLSDAMTTLVDFRIKQHARWPELLRLRLARNCIVHSGRKLTKKYLQLPNARLPQGDLFYQTWPSNQDEKIEFLLAAQKELPLSPAYVVEDIDLVLELARDFAKHIDVTPASSSLEADLEAQLRNARRNP